MASPGSEMEGDEKTKEECDEPDTVITFIKRLKSSSASESPVGTATRVTYSGKGALLTVIMVPCPTV